MSSDPLCRWVVAAASMDGVVGIDLTKSVCQADIDLAEGIVVEGMSRLVTQRIAQLEPRDHGCQRSAERATIRDVNNLPTGFPCDFGH